MAAVRGRPSGLPGFPIVPVSSLRTAATHSPGNERGSSLTLGAKRMSVFDESTLHVLALSTHAFAGGAQ